MRNQSSRPTPGVDSAESSQPDAAASSDSGRLAFCENYLDHEDKPCGGYLVFYPNDMQAACQECGAWCGWMVADYVDLP